MQENNKLFAELEPLLAGAGLNLIELSVSRKSGSTLVRMVVFSPSGTGTAECVKAHRLALPRIQVLLGVQEPSIEVASPGIDRSIKSPREWEIFKGKGARILLKEDSDWIKGRIVASDSGHVTLSTPGGEVVTELSAIIKARLDSSQEGD